MQTIVNGWAFDILIVLFFNHLSMAWNSYDFNASTCPEEESATVNGIFKWNVDNVNSMNYVISHPDICWFNNSIVLRRCNFKTGQWTPRKVYCEKLIERNIKCPDDLIELKVEDEYICLKISKVKQTFDEHFCYGSNVVIDFNHDAIIAKVLPVLLNEYNITSFWMPIKRYGENKFNPFVIRLPGKQWNDMYIYRGTVLSEDNQILSDKDCAAAYIQRDIRRQNQTSMHIRMSHCNEHQYSVCVFKNNFVAKSGCPQDFGALSHRPNECYGITWDGQKFPDDYRMLKVTEYFKKLNTLKIIFDEFDIIDEKYVEIEGTCQIPNGKWAIKPKNNLMKIVSATEKINGLCVEHIQRQKNVEMVLRFDADMESLILTVYNKYYIWSNNNPENSIHCFTNADFKQLSKVEIKKIWENNLSTKTIFKLKLVNDYPGEYWCEAHTIFNFSFVSSKRVVAAKAKKGYVFSMHVEYTLKERSFAFTRDHMKHIAVSIKETLKSISKRHNKFNELSIHNVRIMDVLNISAHFTHMKCLCHTTVSLKSLDTSNEQVSYEESSSEMYMGNSSSSIEVRMKARDLLIALMAEFQPQFSEFVRSIELCLPENDWLIARIGQSATKSKLCLKQDGLPVSRKCLGNFKNGAHWEEVIPSNNICITGMKENLITKNLYTLEKKRNLKEDHEKIVKDVRKLLESNIQNLIPADLYYTANIIRNTVKSIIRDISKTKLDSPLKLRISNMNYTTEYATHTNNLTEIAVEIERIVNYLLSVNDRVMRPSIALNTTNILLDTFEYLIDYISTTDAFRLDTWLETKNISKIRDTNDNSVPLSTFLDENDNEIDIIDYADVGVIVKIATNFIVFMINPLIANVTGIAIFQRDAEISSEFYGEALLKGAFRNEYYRFVLANQSVNELLNKKNILLGTFVPSLLWQRLDEVSNKIFSNKTLNSPCPDARIVIKIYSNDKLFQEDDDTLKKIVGAKIISISIPGHDKDLPEMLPLILTVTDAVNNTKYKKGDPQQNQKCSYWNYQTWAHDGVKLLARATNNNNTVLCGCSHLTPFAFLIGGSYNLYVDSEIEVIVKTIHEQALDIITLLGCALSLFGIAGIFVTAWTFRTWRQKANSKVLLQLSAAIALQMILFCFVNTEENAHHLISNGIFTSCIVIGACLHYSILVQFCWMIIIAYLQFKRYVQVFGNTRPKRFFIKSTIFGWGLPLIPVVCLLAFDSTSYIPNQNELANPICYPSGLSLYISVVLPITLVIFANLVIFILVFYNILKNPAGAIRHTEKSLALSQIRLLVLLFFLLGFTWIFGLLITMNFGLIFSYLFCLTATLQGFILFIYFIVMDPVTRRLWYSYLSKICGLQRDLDSSLSTKETT